ncbi:hypothetical protein QCE62_22040 [Caballeronia sp. LZ033]|uniref:hypothetical protein n=1 Tax=Caballeronia sp. LZ033 TaxID=3038566 RepID=UPI00285F1B2E|nr:hypothetical protein [Caballeronia sp. LZ033]MDR5816280.1 hypothetical protein [Caballeronia sp. LZ033]
MTTARMVELKQALENAGWMIFDEDSDLFIVDDERVVWKIEKIQSGKSLDLIFYLFDDLGRRTQKLADILYVEDNNRRKRLYFSKITSSKWKEDLERFVRSL